MKKRKAWNKLDHQLKIAMWTAGGTSAGGAGAIITGTKDHPLRHILPEAVNYFQYSGNLVWSGLLAIVGVSAAGLVERSRGVTWSARQYAGAAALGGLLVGGAANAAYETRVGYEVVGQHLGLNGGRTAEPWDLVWGASFTALIAGGMAGDLRRYAERHYTAPDPPPLPGGPETLPELPPPPPPPEE